VSPVKYELGFYIPGDAILHSQRREHLKSCILYCNLRLFKNLGTNIPADGQTRLPSDFMFTTRNTANI
jgi:hypothetical protein